MLLLHNENSYTVYVHDFLLYVQLLDYNDNYAWLHLRPAYSHIATVQGSCIIMLIHIVC